MTRFSGLHPMEQEFAKWNSEKRLKRNEYWNSLQKARQEYIKSNDNFNSEKFLGWLRETYGLEAGVTSSGNLTEDYRILDEKKYLMYILKYKS